MLRWAYTAACFSFLLSVSPAQEKPIGQPFLPGEVIVKFSGKSKGAELSARALSEANPSDAGLSSYIQSVSADVGVPLEVRRFGSGGTVILAVRPPELVANLLKRFRDIPSVEDAEVASEQSTSVSTIEVDFKENSREAVVLAQALEKGVESSTEVEAITKKLEQECRVALTARVVSPRHLLVTSDLQRLTLSLAARLTKRGDIEYAQPNFIRRVTGGNSNVKSPM